MPLLIAFIVVPIVEIALIIQVGGLIGTWPTVGLLIATAALGTLLVRAQGFQVLSRARTTLARGVFPARALFDGICLLVAGVFLLTPGFVTDLAGLVLLVPVFRTLIGLFVWRRLLASGGATVRVYGMGRPPRRDSNGNVVEGEYREIRDEAPEIEDHHEDQPDRRGDR